MDDEGIRVRFNDKIFEYWDLRIKILTFNRKLIARLLRKVSTNGKMKHDTKEEL